MNGKILTNLAALSLLLSVVSTQGSYRSPENGGYLHGYPTTFFSTYGYGPSIDGPAYVGNLWGYGFDSYDDWSDYDLPPPAPNPVGPSKTIEIPSGHGQ